MFLNLLNSYRKSALKKSVFVCLVVFSSLLAHSQQVYNSTLLKADKLYIKRDYEKAVDLYLKYLEKFPRDYFASKQAAICYDRLNKPSDAIDHWPIVVESAEATEKDYLSYAKSLLMNNRGPEARKIFILLSKSKDKNIAAWGKTYLTSGNFYKDTAKVKVIELKGVNNELPQLCPVLFKGKLFYSNNSVRAVQNFKASSNLETQYIAAALKTDSVTFSPVVAMEYLQALFVYDQFCFSPDGNKVYITMALSNQELGIKSKTPFYRYRIFEVNIASLNTAKPMIAQLPLGPPEYDYLHPCLSPDGKRLYFASDMKGSLGGKDIFYSDFANTTWRRAVNAGPQVNTPGNEVFPHITADSTLFFASDLRPGLGGLDIFSAKALASGEGFMEAVNCGAGINSRYDDFGVYIINSRSGYFSSKRKENTDDDLYYFIKTAE